MLVLAISLLVSITAITSLQPVKMNPPQLQENIASEGLVKVDAQVKTHTANEKKYEFEVTSLSATHITGKEVSIPIKDIVKLETSEINGLKTTLLTGTIAALVAGLIVVSSFLM